MIWLGFFIQTGLVETTGNVAWAGGSIQPSAWLWADCICPSLFSRSSKPHIYILIIFLDFIVVDLVLKSFLHSLKIFPPPLGSHCMSLSPRESILSLAVLFYILPVGLWNVLCECVAAA